ncbi:hypothetical protein MAR_036221, partial [Mya arenaria]
GIIYSCSHQYTSNSKVMCTEPDRPLIDRGWPGASDETMILSEEDGIFDLVQKCTGHTLDKDKCNILSALLTYRNTPERISELLDRHTAILVRGLNTKVGYLLESSAKDKAITIRLSLVAIYTFPFQISERRDYGYAKRKQTFKSLV